MVETMMLEADQGIQSSRDDWNSWGKQWTKYLEDKIAGVQSEVDALAVQGQAGPGASGSPDPEALQRLQAKCRDLQKSLDTMGQGQAKLQLAQDALQEQVRLLQLKGIASPTMAGGDGLVQSLEQKIASWGLDNQNIWKVVKEEKETTRKAQQELAEWKGEWHGEKATFLHQCKVELREMIQMELQSLQEQCKVTAQGQYTGMTSSSSPQGEEGGSSHQEVVGGTSPLGGGCSSHIQSPSE